MYTQKDKLGFIKRNLLIFQKILTRNWKDKQATELIKYS